MFSTKRNATVSLGWWAGIACLGGLGFGAYGLSKTDCSVQGKAERKFTMDVDFDAFRQILVRTNATAAILEHGGMKLLDEKTEAVDIDLSNDSRPLRNALRGKSKANLSATKHLTVRLNDPQLKATELQLSQDCQIQPDHIHVHTASDRPAGELKSYNTTLDAVKSNNGTVVSLALDMTVNVYISRVFVSHAEARVKEAAEKAMQEQEAAIRKLVSEFDDHAVILPKMKR